MAHAVARSGARAAALSTSREMGWVSKYLFRSLASLIRLSAAPVLTLYRGTAPRSEAAMDQPAGAAGPGRLGIQRPVRASNAWLQ